MRYLLDTNTWIHYLKSVASPVEARLRQIPVGQVVVCSVVRAELLHGARKYERRNERVARIERMLSPFRSLPFDDAAARDYASIRDTLETSGQVIGANDLLIAAIAITHSLTLVTNDQGFGRVPGLVTEDWTAPYPSER
ncbi:MAG: type II toxin-antitoxin system VapC family toxin [Thermoguttaceae bacterium]|jgi:tRNA(fMet)-specific endonuclease VapC|nr:type II toxin-antitoxin system VapC family toxin [Thermoguttaceae bacterium]